MGGFTLFQNRHCADHEVQMARQLGAMREQGFAEPEELVAGDSVLFVYPKQISPVENTRTFPNGDFVAVCGTFYYQGKTGFRGLEQIYSDFDPPAAETSSLESEPLPEPLRGTYVCFVYKSGRLWVFTDRIGFYRVYETRSGEVLTSSFLTAIACTPAPRLHAQCVYEYVFQGAMYGSETIIQGIQQFCPDSLLVLENKRRRKCSRPNLAQPLIENHPLNEHCERIGAELDRLFDDCIRAFDGLINTALSGGYDSRLILAYLLRGGVIPNVHVYGSNEDADVRVAKTIAAGEDFPLAHIDKSRYRAMPLDEEWPSILERNFRAFDGIPTDGIFDYGADLATRQSRAKGGVLSLNGGGGEIFRNFFYLRDRSFSTLDIVWAFYRQFDPRCFANVYDSREYEERLAEKINKALAASSERLTRAEVERVYPLFRCRYWMGRNSSINNRFGLMHTPLVEPSVVELAGTCPMVFKNGGRLGRHLIRRVDARLASYGSAYGYPFDEEPPRSEIIREKMSLFRPTVLRKWSFRLRGLIDREKRLRQKESFARFDSLVEVDEAAMREFFRLDQLLDVGQIRRMKSIAYLCKRML